MKKKSDKDIEKIRKKFRKIISSKEFSDWLFDLILVEVLTQTFKEELEKEDDK